LWIKTEGLLKSLQGQLSNHPKRISILLRFSNNDVLQDNSKEVHFIFLMFNYYRKRKDKLSAENQTVKPSILTMKLRMSEQFPLAICLKARGERDLLLNFMKRKKGVKEQKLPRLKEISFQT
jgi:hypothetical protein